MFNLIIKHDTAVSLVVVGVLVACFLGNIKWTAMATAFGL